MKDKLKKELKEILLDYHTAKKYDNGTINTYHWVGQILDKIKEHGTYRRCNK